ncbi:MAG: hypothetical protein Q8Q60_04485 [Candidatus Chromulinivorax sp.]|nr:hypothetical protein [Candidatus Chromulinivorax sp.]
MKMNIILCVSVLSVGPIFSMDRFAPTGRIANVQQRIEDLQQELGIVVADDVKKNKSEREMNQELRKLVYGGSIRKLKNATQQDIESLQVLPRPPHVAK